MSTAIASASYSNGYNVSLVMAALMNRRRWRQPTRTDFTFTLSGSNVWPTNSFNPLFESIHKIVTPYNIWVVQEDKDINEANFNAYLQNLQADVILKCLSSVFNKKEFLEKKLLFERFGRQDYVNENTGLFACVRILPAKFFDVSVQVDSVALKFDQDVTFNLYLFHDTQPSVPIDTIEVTAKENEQSVVNIGRVLNYAGANKSGVYYLGYFQDDLGGAKAINEIVEKFNPMFNFGCVPVELKKNGATSIDVNQVSFTIKTHGFNIQLSAFRDYTQLIVDSAYLFDNLIGLQMAADVIEMIQNNTRTNKDQRVTQELTKMLYTDLNHAGPTEESPFSAGLKSKIEREVHRMKCEFFPKKKATSITHDTQSKNIYGTPAPLMDVFQY